MGLQRNQTSYTLLHGGPTLNYRWIFNCASQVTVVKDLPANVEDAGCLGSILGSGRSPGGGNGNPLQYSCLENPMDRGA